MYVSALQYCSCFPAMSAPACANMAELAGAAGLRALLAADPGAVPPALARHLRQGLAYTAGAALGEAAPAREECAAAVAAPNAVGLSAGARAWAKHAHRSDGWWGTAHGSVAALNARALELFDKIVDGATWRNLHWLPHRVLVYEARVREGYGMRWAQDRSRVPDAAVDANADAADHADAAGDTGDETAAPPWIFRGFVEPMMENGHEVGWRH
jgi:hypothetical protein